MGNKHIQRVRVSDDSQLHLSTTYPRKRDKTKEKVKPKRVFNFVLTGLLISSTLMGSVFTNQGDVFASKGEADTSPVAHTVAVNPYQDEMAMISNLNMATKVLTQGISSGEISVSMYEKVLNSLTAIEVKLDSDSHFENVVDLSPVLHDTGMALVEDSGNLPDGVNALRDASIESLKGVYDKLGLELPAFNVVDIDTATDVLGASVTNRTYKDLNLKYVSHKNIKWAADRGYLNSYTNTTHPTKRYSGKGNWVDYQSNIRERDMLSAVFKYVRSSEYGKLSVANKRNAYSKEYQLASKYGVPTKASITNTSKYSSAVSRLDFARALSYAHYGKKVTDAQAIKFMYTANIMKGDKVGSKYPKTTASFGSNTRVTRADVAMGIKAYDSYKTSLSKKSATVMTTSATKGVTMSVKASTTAYTSKSTKSKAVFKVATGAKVQRIATYRSWSQIKYNGKTGWVASSKLTTQVSSSTSKAVEMKTKRYTTVYSSRSTKSKTVFKVKTGSTVKRTDVNASWSKITYNGKSGWVASSNLTTLSTSGTPSTTPTKPPATSVGVTKTYFGAHTYGVDTQAEYDAVYKRVKAEFDAKYNSPEFGFSEHIQRVLNGERGTDDRNDPNFRRPDNVDLLMAEKALAPYFDGRMSLKTYEKLYRSNKMYTHLYNKYNAKSVEGDKNLKSAYDVLFRGKSDCDSSEQLKSLVYDLAGIDNVIIGDGVTHALLLFKVDEGWMGSNYKAFTEKDIDSTNALNIYISYTQKGAKISY